MAIVEITIRERVATVSAGIVLVCNNPTDTIRFNFDEEWTEHDVKTARFAFDRTYIDVPFSGNEVQVPNIYHTSYVNIGVYTDDLTSTYVKVACRASVKCLGGKNSSPSQDVYNQIIALINEIKPVKGVDYWTDTDRAEIVSDVLTALETWEGGSY